jgi:hypothetical protein
VFSLFSRGSAKWLLTAGGQPTGSGHALMDKDFEGAKKIKNPPEAQRRLMSVKEKRGPSLCSKKPH